MEDDYSLKLQKCNEYIVNLEEERRKIQVFQRELPLCLDLVTQAIVRCRRELICCEETTSDHERPVFEEFMPINRHSSTDSDNDDNEEEEEEEEKSDEPTMDEDKSGTKSDWLSSVQLWNNQTPTLDPSSKEDTHQKEVVKDVKTNDGGTCKAVNKEMKDKSSGKVETTVASSSVGTDSGESRKDDKAGQSGRKKRRCWSPELHMRFVNALHQLGGLHVATPKQIREFMKVDGLTNDEVKSHLQKYRLHTRRPNSNNGNNNNNNNHHHQQQQQQTQFLVVGGIWVHPPPAATGVTTGNGVYTPIPLKPQAKHNCTTSNSSSTRTTTASPVF